MARKIEEKTVQLGKVTPSLNKSLVDYAKLIGITKIELIESLIAKELEGKVLDKEFIVPDKPFYFNLNELLEEGTVKASTNKPSTDFNKYYTVKKIANNLDSKNADFRTYCYNDNKALHKGIFIYYFFSSEANPVPLVFDYNSEAKELVISLIKLSDLSFLIETEEDVTTIKDIVETAKVNIEHYNSEGASNKTIGFMASISEVIEDFKGRKMIDLLVKYNVNEIDNPEKLSDLNIASIHRTNPYESILKDNIEKGKEIEELTSKYKEPLENIVKKLEEIEEVRSSEEEKTKIWNDLVKNSDK